MAKKTKTTAKPKEGLLENAWQKLGVAWREIVRVSKRSGADPTEGPEAWRSQFEACLSKKGGEVSARKRAAALARSYLGFSPEERLDFLSILCREYAADADRVAGAIGTLQDAADQSEIENARYGLLQALEPARLKLLREFNTLQSGPRFLVELRRELIALKAQHPELAPLERDLKALLKSWFDVGFLELRSINWNSPASLLEKLGRYEAVHRVRSWQDLKNRLDIDRRCFAFFHPCMEDEPLIFIEVALVKGLAVQIQDLLNEKDLVLDTDDVDTAIFYSISNAQQGLVGISFGNFLIKQVVDKLRSELPHLKRFSTLSPIPGFMDWLQKELEHGSVSLAPAEIKQLKSLAPNAHPLDWLASTLKSNGWTRDETLRSTLKPILLRLCAGYLLNIKGRDGVRAVNPVAHFHLSNGARIEQLNWMGDTSAKGLRESAGIMVNYLYRLDRIESCHEDYSSKGKINASKSVSGLVG